ncbi:uncharacterized protein HMPREF1541_03567 [Cyphellophora europaea CBS 101466]|uniref:Riboflavin kinase n=1 Tax=Cyphellophora europaea (strain CBS 101466) TaxID=1220924 RepID=W2RYQ0_CYPE1|nr:uncharacterized protein HMPREF1541_03567 [Cyphellophora europaea CBS 101466]ETN41631.1 hypothetical protein HMPREF1541_03567 [Cyphellophora europaea CBS 101466]
MEDRRQAQIRRKPVPISPISPPPPYEYTESPVSISAGGQSGYDSTSFDGYIHEPSARPQQYLTVDGHRPPPPIHSLRTTKSSPNLQQPTKKGEAAQKAGKAVATAFEEARHFAGGLVSHPFESTKYYSILRHSHGLVFYSGSYTSIAITVFADRDLPSDRSFWLQRKGWSGNTGLRAGVLFGTHGAWVNVTPSVIAMADQIKQTDERAWQRDISKFIRKAPKKLGSHVPRETAILRIPCDAEDGYLRIVMCSGENGKKTLCPSPVFRLASTSMESSSMRGASLKTMPLEAAVKIGTTVGTQVVNRFAGPYITTAKTFVAGATASVYQPNVTQTLAIQEAYDKSGLSDRLDTMNAQYDQRRGVQDPLLSTGGYDIAAPPIFVGGDDGPTPPFPLRFKGKVVPGQGYSTRLLGLPSANLSGVDSDITLKHSGIYFGYAAIGMSRKLLDERGLDDDWHKAIISITPLPGSQANVVQKKKVVVNILEDFEDANFYDAKLSVMLMGFLRPAPPLHLVQQGPAEVQMMNFRQDMAVTGASLSRPAWAADMTLERVRTASSSRSLTDRYVDVRQGVQNTVDKVPVHWLGIRTEGQGTRDRFVGSGGISIPR